MPSYLVAEVGHVDVSVLEVGDEHKVVVYHHVREQVIKGDIAETENVDGVDHTTQGGKNTDVRPDDVQTIPRREQG